MSLITLPDVIRWPGIGGGANAAIAIAAANLLDVAGKYTAAIANAATAMTISHIGFYPQASSSGVVTASIQTLSSGNPSGTLWNAAGEGSTGTSGTCTAGTWELVALAAPASISVGQDFAVVITYSSGTSVTTGSLGNNFIEQSQVPYRVTNVTGSAVKSLGSSLQIAVGSSATVWYPVRNMYPVIAVNQTGFNNTNSAARAARFQVPFPCRVIGLRFFVPASGGNFNIILMDDAGSELSSSSTGKTQANAASALQMAQSVHFDNPVVLAINTWYRAVIEPNSATNFNLVSLQCPSAAYLTGMPGGTNFHYATRASGSWTDTATDTVPMLDLLIDQLDDGVSAGGANPLNGLIVAR